MVEEGTGARKPRRRIFVRLLIGAGLACCMYFSWTGHLAPPPKPATASEREFSAERAMTHVRAMSRAPHPAGSAENDRVRDYIVEQLRALGTEPQVQEALVNRGPGESATVQNVLARVPGTDSDGVVLLLAHYDSVAFGPGAADDGAGCAGLLEALRAVKSGPPLKNDLVFLFTDGEEGRIAGVSGLRGAYGFVHHHPWAKEVKVAVNFDCRGTRGVSYMYECSAPNRWLVRQLNHAETRAVATSSMAEIYYRMPVATDLTMFFDEGIPGLNFAFIDGLEYYHTALDSPENLSQKSLQHHGQNALGMARRLGSVPLDGAGRGDSSVFFYVPLIRMIQYSLSWVWPLTALALAVFVAGLAVGLRRGRIRPLAVFYGLLLYAVVWLVCALVGLAIFLVTYHGVSFYFVYTSLPLTVTALAAAGALFFLVMGLAHRRLGIADLWAALLLPWAAMLVLASRFMPGASYLLFVPLLLASLGFLWLMLRRKDPEKCGFGDALVMLALSFPAMFFITGTAQGLYTAILLLGVALQVSLFVLLLGAVFPLFAWMAGGHLRTTSAVFLAVGVAALAVAGSRAGFSPERPKFNSLTYALNADTGQAFWLSCDPEPDAWTAEKLGDSPRREVIHDLLPLATRPADYLRAPAPAFPLAPPTLEVLADETHDGVRTVKLRADSPRGAQVLEIAAEPGLVVRAARLNGVPLKPGDGGRWFLTHSIYRGGGLELELDVDAGRVFHLHITDFSYGFPEGAGISPRPPDMVPKPNTVDFNKDRLKTDETVVTRMVRI